RAPQRACGVAEVLPQDVPVRRDGVGDHVRERRQEDPYRGKGTGELARPFAEGVAELLAILGPEERGVEAQQGAVEAHHTVSGLSPRARASRTSWESRRISARATSMPKGVRR